MPGPCSASLSVEVQSFQTGRVAVFFVSGRAKGLPVLKQRLSHWIVEAIALAYASKNESCPCGVHVHFTRKLASSWAWVKSMSIQDI